MNDKIDELAKQSGFDYDPTDCNFYSPDSSQWINKEIYKFAELIIKQCLGIYESIENGNHVMGTYDYPEAVVKHFGIK